MSEQRIGPLQSFLYLPYDPENQRANGQYALFVPLPGSKEEADEPTNDWDGAQIELYDWDLARLIEKISVGLATLNFKGTLHIFGQDPMPLYGAIDFRYDPPKADLKYEQLVRTYQDIAETRRRGNARRTSLCICHRNLDTPYVKLKDQEGGCCS